MHQNETETSSNPFKDPFTGTSMSRFPPGDRPLKALSRIGIFTYLLDTRTQSKPCNLSRVYAVRIHEKSIHAHHILDKFCRDTTTNKSCRRYPFFESACGITQSWIIQALPQSPQLLLHHALLLAGPAQPQTWLQVPGRTDRGQ